MYVTALYIGKTFGKIVACYNLQAGDSSNDKYAYTFTHTVTLKLNDTL